MFDEIVRRVRKEMRVDQSFKIEGNSTLNDLGLSSLQVADIIFTLEEDFNLELDEERASKVKTLGELVVLIEESIEAKSPGALQAAKASG